MKIPPLKENIRSFLALYVITLLAIVLVIALLFPTKADEKLVYLIIGSMFGLAGSALAYFFSASKPQSNPDNSTITKLEKTITETPKDKPSEE